MSKKIKLIIINVIIAIVSIVMYIALIPHEITTKKYTSKTYEATVTTIPISKNEIIKQAVLLFIVIMLPTIIYGAKQILNPYRLNKNCD